MIQLTEIVSGVDVSRDSVVILLHTFSLNGGRVLDVTGFAPTAIQAGHIIIREDATGTYKPLGVTGTAFNALPADHSYAGICVASVDKVTQGGGVGVLVAGAVNTKAMPYTMTTEIDSALRTALNHIYFTFDNQ